MLTDVAWVVLHGGHNDGGAVSFEVVLGALVSVLVVVGALWYVGAFASLGSSGGGGDVAAGSTGDSAGEGETADADPGAGAGD